MISTIACTLFAFLLIYAAVAWIKSYHRARPVEQSNDAEPCEYCGYDLRATPDRCPECGHAAPLARTRRLREEWPGNPISLRRPEAGERPCVVFNTFSGVLADLLRQHLECRGVECQIVRATGGIDPASMTPIPHAAVLTVWSGDVELATDIIHRLLPPDNVDEQNQSAETAQPPSPDASVQNVKP